MTVPVPDSPRREPSLGGRMVEVAPDGRARPTHGLRREGVPFLIGGEPHPDLAALELDERLLLLERAAAGLHTAHRLGWIHGGLRGSDLRRVERADGTAVVIGGIAGRAGATVGDDLAGFGAILAALCSPDIVGRRTQRRDIDAIAAACAATEHGYPSAAHLEHDLARLRRGHAVSVRPEGAVDQLRRVAARRPTLVMALAIVTMSALLVVVVGLARARDAESDRLRLRTQAERTLALLRELDDHVGTGAIRDRLAATLLEQAEFLAGDDESSRRLLVEAIIGAGTLARERGRRDEARVLRERAVAEAEALAATEPRSFDARRLLAHALIVQGDLEKESGDSNAGYARYERALSIEESLLAERPSDRGQVLRTGWGYERCAFLDARRPGGEVLAISRLNRAEELTARLLEKDPADPEARWLSLIVRRHRIDALERRGALEAASELRAATLAEIRSLASETGASRRFSTALAHWQTGEALRQHEAGRHDEARVSMAEALRTIREAEFGDGGSVDSEATRLWAESVAVRVGVTLPNGPNEGSPGSEILDRLRALEADDPRARAFLRAIEDALAELARPEQQPPASTDGPAVRRRGATGGPPG